MNGGKDAVAEPGYEPRAAAGESVRNILGGMGFDVRYIDFASNVDPGRVKVSDGGGFLVGSDLREWLETGNLWIGSTHCGWEGRLSG